MKQLELVPVVEEFSTFKEFAEVYHLSENDVILTNEYIYDPTIKVTGVPCKTIFLEKYGTGEPSDVMVNGVLEAMNDMKVDKIIAVGGGTIIDIAKILCVADHDKDVNDMYDRMANLEKKHELYVIPTTCGTGSEVTNISIVNRTKLGTKQGLVAYAMYPSHAVLIPEFIETLPYGVFATSSIDALIHAIESYLSPLATPYTRIFSVEAIKMILSGYVKVAEKENTVVELAEDFLRASNYAGIAFGNAGCGTVHAMSYAFGGKYHVAHGESNYQFLMAVLNLYVERKPDGAIRDLQDVIAGVLGGDAFVSLDKLLSRILTLKPMHEYGAVQEDIEAFAASTITNQQRLLGKSYIPLTQEDLKNLYQSRL